MQRGPATRFLQQVRRTIARCEMLAPGDRILVGVSGGPDSVALLAALVTLSRPFRITVRAAHLNHRLRGQESVRDQQWAQTVAQQLGVPCVVADGPPLVGAANLEARAREHRYAFLTDVARAQGCTKIATGHTLDDQAETVLMRLLRGAGSDGLAGIRAVRDGWIIRPLIDCSRAQVLAYLTALGVAFCEDSSNQQRRFLRNRVRHDVLPLLQAINPRVTRNLAETADTLAREGALLDDAAGAVLAGAEAGDGTLAIVALVESAPALRGRLVRAWLRKRRGHVRGLTAAHVRAVVSLAQGRRPNGRVRLPHREQVVREYGRLRWCARDAAAVVDAPQVLVPGSTVCLASGWRIRAEFTAAPVSPSQLPADLWELVADGDAIASPLVVRTARPGDRVWPLGVHGRRKLHDIFVDRKLPLLARRGCPVVECDGEILWVPGMVRSQRALITPATRSAVHLVAEKIGVAGT